MIRPGSVVFLKTLKRKGVVRAIVKDRAHVEVDDKLVHIESDLLELYDSKRHRKLLKDGPRRPPPVTLHPVGKASEEIDLHGMTVEDALTVLRPFLDAAIRAELSVVKIVHGKGTGRVRDAVHAYLNQLTAVSTYKVDEANTGMTRVYF